LKFLQSRTVFVFQKADQIKELGQIVLQGRAREDYLVLGGELVQADSKPAKVGRDLAVLSTPSSQ